MYTIYHIHSILVHVQWKNYNHGEGTLIVLYGSALAEDILAMLLAAYSTLLDSHVERILGHVDLWEGSSISIVLHGKNKCNEVERECNVKGRRGRERERESLYRQ